MRRNGTQFLNVDAEDTNTFCNKVLSLGSFPHVNMRINDTATFHVPLKFRKLPPLQAIQAYRGRVKCYVGISAQIPRNARPLTQVAKYFYGGSKTRATEDGWQRHYLLDVLDADFDTRRYNGGWAERKLIIFMRTLPNVEVVNESDEPEPIFGENRCNLPDNSFIGLYLCLQFVE
jgi:hypothetical protein